MYEQLKSLEQRLRNASGEMWLEIQMWHFDRKGDPNREAEIERLSACERIIDEALTKVQNALEVVEAAA